MDKPDKITRREFEQHTAIGVAASTLSSTAPIAAVQSLTGMPATSLWPKLFAQLAAVLPTSASYKILSDTRTFFSLVDQMAEAMKGKKDDVENARRIWKAGIRRYVDTKYKVNNITHTIDEALKNGDDEFRKIVDQFIAAHTIHDEQYDSGHEIATSEQIIDSQRISTIITDYMVKQGVPEDAFILHWFVPHFCHYRKPGEIFSYEPQSKSELLEKFILSHSHYIKDIKSMLMREGVGEAAANAVQEAARRETRKLVREYASEYEPNLSLERRHELLNGLGIEHEELTWQQAEDKRLHEKDIKADLNVSLRWL